MDDVNYNIKKSFTIGKFIFGSLSYVSETNIESKISQ